MPSELRALREDPHHAQRAKQLAACSSRVRPAEGANARSARGGRQPAGRRLSPLAATPAGRLPDAGVRVPGVLSDVWIHREGPPES